MESGEADRLAGMATADIGRMIVIQVEIGFAPAERIVSSVISGGQLIRQANIPDKPIPALTFIYVPLM